MLNETLLLQIFSLITVILYLNTLNILSVWYLAGLFLFNTGFIALLDDGDIFIGFLWVIDFGVGIVFFIFILHFSTFLHQKTLQFSYQLNFSTFAAVLLMLIITMLFYSTPNTNPTNTVVSKTWLFNVSWYDYYDFLNINNVSNLNVLREVYFFNNSFEFVIINFVVFYGVITAVLLCFSVKSFFTNSLAQTTKFKSFFELTTPVYFIRSQNIITQQTASAGLRVWAKLKSNDI